MPWQLLISAMQSHCHDAELEELATEAFALLASTSPGFAVRTLMATLQVHHKEKTASSCQAVKRVAEASEGSNAEESQHKVQRCATDSKWVRRVLCGEGFTNHWLMMQVVISF